MSAFVRVCFSVACLPPGRSSKRKNHSTWSPDERNTLKGLWFSRSFGINAGPFFRPRPYNLHASLGPSALLPANQRRRLSEPPNSHETKNALVKKFRTASTNFEHRKGHRLCYPIAYLITNSEDTDVGTNIARGILILSQTITNISRLPRPPRCDDGAL